MLVKAEVFNIIGELSGKYKFIEDWSTHLRLARENIHMYFSDFDAVRHRDGGISHATEVLPKVLTQDLVKITEGEVLPYISRFSESDWIEIRDVYIERVSASKEDKNEEGKHAGDEGLLKIFVKWDNFIRRCGNLLAKSILLLSPLSVLRFMIKMKKKQP